MSTTLGRLYIHTCANNSECASFSFYIHARWLYYTAAYFFQRVYISQLALKASVSHPQFHNNFSRFPSTRGKCTYIHTYQAIYSFQ